MSVKTTMINLSFLIIFSFLITSKCDTTGNWVGIGYGHSMQNVDMNVVMFNQDSTYSLEDQWATGNFRPTVDTLAGGTSDLKNDTFVSENGKAVLTFQRKYDTGDSKDEVLKPETSFQVTIAYGPLPFSYHGSNLKKLSLSISKEAGSALEEDSNEFNFWDFHGISLTVFWAGFNFFGYLSARFFRHRSAWLWVHAIGSGLTALFTIGLLSKSVQEAYDPPEDAPFELFLHIYFGLIFFGLICLQTISGGINYILIYLRKNYQTGRIHSVKNIHKVLGMIMTFTAYISIISGFSYHFPDLVFVPVILCVVFLVIICIFEVAHLIMLFFSKNKYVVKAFVDKTKSDAKNKGGTYYVNLIELNERIKSNYVLYENYVCDVEKFVSIHPGGAHLIQDNMFLDVGRYMTGNQPYNDNFTAHSHNLLSHKFLIENLSFAEIKEDHKIIKQFTKEQNIEMRNFNEINNSTYLNNIYFEIVDCKLEAENVYAIKFKPKVGKFEFSRFLTNVNWIGKHFSVTLDSINKTRYYSLSLAMDEEIKNLHLKLLRNAGIENQEETEELTNDPENLKQSYLQLFIKKYDSKGTLSKELHNPNLNDVTVRGPLGPGLNLYNNKLKGTHVVLAAGTGIFPFADLIAFTLRYAVNKITNNKLSSNENFDNIVDDSFRLKVFVSFQNPKQELFMDVCQELEEFDKKHQLNIFSLVKRLSSEKSKRWDADFFKNQLGDAKEITKVYLVGPIQFITKMKHELLKSDLTKHQIFLV